MGTNTTTSRNDHGKPHGPPAKGPHKEAAPNRPLPRPAIPDDDDDGLIMPLKPPGAQVWVIPMSVSKAIMLGLFSVLCLGAVVTATLMYADNRAKAELQSRIAAAIDNHTALHRHDGTSVHAITVTDSIRSCVAATLLPLDFVFRNGLKEASGEAIVNAAEKHCLNTMIVDVAKNEIIAQEAMRQAIDPTDKERDVEKQDQLLHFIITFAKLKGYTVPDEFKNFKTDISILNRFMDSPDGQPLDDRTARAWLR